MQEGPQRGTIARPRQIGAWPGFPPALLCRSPSAAADPYAQRVAFLLICWLILGWLVPTLLLLPDRDINGGQPETSSDDGSRAAAVTRFGAKFASLLEAWLRLLAPAQRAQHARRGGQDQGGGAISSGATLVLHWWAVVMMCWAAACSASPLFLAGRDLDRPLEPGRVLA